MRHVFAIKFVVDAETVPGTFLDPRDWYAHIVDRLVTGNPYNPEVVVKLVMSASVLDDLDYAVGIDHV